MDNEWDALCGTIVADQRLESRLTCYKSELQTIRLLSEPKLCATLASWIVSLRNVRSPGEEKSNQFRERGNEIFKSKANIHLALEAYSKAIFAAKEGTVALALAHANRAVVLMKLGCHQQAFDDCQLALDGPYPEGNRSKVLFRQSDCALTLGDYERMQFVIAGIEGVQEKRVLTKAEVDRLEQMRALVAKYGKQDAGEERNFLVDDVCPVLMEKCTPTAGRHMVTTEMIEEDAVIVREQAASFVPVYDPESKSTIPSFDCQRCGSVNVIPFPCPTCGRACYCSPKCQTEHRAVHRYECHGYRKHLWYTIGIAHLGCRTFLDGFRVTQADGYRPKTADDLFAHILDTADTGGVYGDYGKVLRLVTNFDKMAIADVVQYALAALMLSVYLRDFTNFFDDAAIPGIAKGELLVYVGALIMRHIGQMVCNGHAISELRATLPSGCCCLEPGSLSIEPGMLHRYLTSVRAFTAIFPQISLFNHSCEPNIRNCFDGNTLTVHATDTIPAGEEIFNCYGPCYRQISTAERRKLLREQYCFECRCKRCLAKDDTVSDRYEQFRCPSKGCGTIFIPARSQDVREDRLQCPKCSGSIDCSWYEHILGTVEKTDFSYDLFQRYLKSYDSSVKVLAKHNRIKIGLIQALMERFLLFATMDARCLSEMKKLALELAQLWRHQFGHMSLEYLVGCFYLVDLLVLETRCMGRPTVDAGAMVALQKFRRALFMVGTSTRTTVREYLMKWLKNIEVDIEDSD